MRIQSGLKLFLILIARVSCAKQQVPRATLKSLNLNTTAYSSTPIPTCCYIGSNSVTKIQWYSSSLEITVATISTIVYQCDNTAVTSYVTIMADNSQSLPTGSFNFESVSGLPTTILDKHMDPYLPFTTLVYGIEYTDLYGVVYTSPTPVWSYSYMLYSTFDATSTGTHHACPTPDLVPDGIMIDIYPSGFFFTDDNPVLNRNYTGEISGALPSQIRDWMVSHVSPNDDTLYSNIAQCTMGYGDGVPVAHVPVNELTVAAETTVTVKGTLSGQSKPPESELQTTAAAKTADTVVEPHPTSVSATPDVVIQPTAAPTHTTSEEYTKPVLPPSESAQAPSPTSSIKEPNAPVPTAAPNTESPAPGLSPIAILSPSTSPTGALVLSIGGSTLTPGGTAVLPSTGTESPVTYILPSSGPAVIVNGATQTFEATLPSPTTPVLAIGSSTLTLNSDSAYVFGTQTLTLGGAVTASGGEVLSLETGGASVVVVSGSITSTEGLGGIINSIGGFAGTETASGGASPSGPIQITSSGARAERCGRFETLVGLWMGIVVGVMMV